MSGTIIDFHGRSADRQARLEQQIARITALLEELEDMNCGAQHVPLSLVAQAQAGLRQASGFLLPAPGHPHGVQGEPDPQPEVDREVLERMYRALDRQR
jgi:hypothetical protein